MPSDLLRALLERWYISERETLIRTLEISGAHDSDEPESEEVSFDAYTALEQARRDLEAEINNLKPQDAFLLKCWAEGATPREIASQTNLSVTTVYARLKFLQKRVLYRSLKLSGEPAKGKASAATLRLQAFAKLQRSLSLTPAKAAEWQNAVHEARR